MTRRAGTLFALAAATGVLAGCAVGPNYKRPAVTAPEQVRGAPAAEAASLADRPWWEVFGDDALKSLIDEALRNNYDIREAAWRVAEFRARAGVARADFYPQVGYSGQVSRSRQSDFVVPGATAVTLYDVNLGLSWELDLWGRIRRLSESALARYLATEEARRGVLLSTVADVARAYFALRELDARLEIARRTTDAFKETLDLFSRQLAGGIASQLEVSRAEGAMRNAAGAVSDLERQIVAQENLIGFLLGRNPGPVARGASLTGQALVPEVPAGLPSALLERRPDIRQAEQELIAANAEIGAARAEYFPRISLTGFFGAQSRALSDLLSGPATLATATVGATAPIFNAGRTRANVRFAEAVQREAVVNYQRVIYTALRDVADSLADHGKTSEQRVQQERLVAALRESTRLATERYRGGLDSYLPVLDAQRNLFQGELELAQLRQRELTSIVQLYRALGGGWRES